MKKILLIAALFASMPAFASCSLSDLSGGFCSADMVNKEHAPNAQYTPNVLRDLHKPAGAPNSIRQDEFPTGGAAPLGGPQKELPKHL